MNAGTDHARFSPVADLPRSPILAGFVRTRLLVLGIPLLLGLGADCDVDEGLRPREPESPTVIAGGGLKAYEKAMEAFRDGRWNEAKLQQYNQEIDAAYYRGLAVPPSQRSPLGPNPAAVSLSPGSVAAIPGTQRSKLGRMLQGSPRGGALFIGGFDEGAGQVSSAALLYDGVTDTWTRTGDLHQARELHTAITLADERVFVFGGTDFVDTIFDSGEVFDPITGGFTSVGSAMSPHLGHTASLLEDGRVLIVGGTSTLDQAVDFADRFADNEFFDAATGQYSVAPALMRRRSGHAAVVLNDGRVLIVGGTVDDFSAPPAEIYDPAADMFILASNDPPTATQNQLTATLLEDGRVFLAGGRGLDVSPVAATAIFDPASDSFAAGPDLNTPRAGHQAVRLPDGTVLIIGGQDAEDDLATSEMFDPVAGTITPSDTMMSVPRYQFAAVAIP